VLSHFGNQLAKLPSGIENAKWIAVVHVPH
jgi:hypothetical protein